MSFQFSVPIAEGAIQYSLEPGESLIFVGANGGGKTRLAVHIERLLGDAAHRISAHRALVLNPTVAKISEVQAVRALRFGITDETANFGRRDQARWRNKAATYLLNDFDHLLQALFAEKTNTTDRTHKAAKAGTLILDNVESSKFEVLEEIWTEILPHRQLHISGDDIQVSLPTSQDKYSGSEMSDGERAIFYMIGQTLVAEPDSLLIIDEPELHVHRSIMSKLWDRLEAIRPDCAFVFITHDLEFAADRKAQKVVIKGYEPTPTWQLENVPIDTGFSEEIATLILGSRRPVLFVEGGSTSLDVAIYRCCYPDWTVISRNSCQEVIHSVVTMRRNKSLTRVTCSGLIDADSRDEDDRKYLAELGVATLPVSEIENIVLLPSVSRSIGEHEGLQGAELETRLAELKEDIFAFVDAPEKIEAVVVRFCKRRIDYLMKKIDLGEVSNAKELETAFAEQTGKLNVGEIASTCRDKIEGCIRDRNLAELLTLLDNKGMLVCAARRLRANRLDDFEGWLTRVMRNPKIAPSVTSAISATLPTMKPA